MDILKELRKSSKVFSKVLPGFFTSLGPAGCYSMVRASLQYNLALRCVGSG